jgi:AAA domain
MRLSISGTYSSGKTFTSMALSHYTGIPRSPAKTIREILPEAVPGKRLAEVSPAEYVQLAVRRHVGRAVNEALLGDTFIADGSSLQEWVYAVQRVTYGMDPARYDPAAPPPLTAEMAFFEEVMGQLGHAFKQHVAGAFDGFVHLVNEFELSKDGHRPMNEQFRGACDAMLLETLKATGLPYLILGGSVQDRLSTIVAHYGLPVVTGIERAVELADRDYRAIDWRLETERVPLAAS